MKWMFLKILQLKTAKGEECLCHLRGELDYFVDTEKQEDFFLLFFFFFFSSFFFWLHPVAYGILVPWPGIEDFLIGNDGTVC